MKRKLISFLLLVIASFSLYAGVIYYGSGRAVLLENIIQFANFFEIEATGIKNLRLGGEVKAHNVQAANVDKNFIPFGGFETGDEDFTSYVDAAGVLPVDGTGGGPSSFLTCAQSATSPLEGDGSLNMVKFNTASGGKGHGCSYDFTVSTAGQAQGMTLSFDYKWTDVAANEDGDFIVYLYDVDKSQLVAPVPYEIKKSQYVTKFISGFMTDAASTNYRLIFHLAQDRAGIFSLKVDNLFVGKSTYARGSPITDWVLMGFTTTNIGNATNSIYGKRVGDSLHFKGEIVIGTTLPTGGLVLNLPSGMLMDTSKIPNNGTNYVGVLEARVGGISYGGSLLRAATTSSFIFIGDSGIAQWNATTPVTWAAGNHISVEGIVPIAGWSSNVVMSETMPGRDVVLILKGNLTSQTFNQGTITKITNWAVEKNPANIWDAANSQLTIPESGYYSVSAAFTISDVDVDLTATFLRLYKNGSSLINRTYAIEGEISSHQTIAESAIYFLKGDILDLRTFQSNSDSDNLSVTSGATTQNFSLAKLNTGNQTIGLEETVLQKVSAVSNPNLIINGGFDLWQRGTSQTTSGYGSDDRWQNSNDVSTKTASRQTSTDTERALFNSPYYSRTVVSSVAGASNSVVKRTNLEDVTKLAGKTVTLSFWAKADASKNIAAELSQRFGTGGSPSAIVNGIGAQKVALTTTWQKKVVTIGVPSIVGKTIGTDGINTSYIALFFWFDAGSDFNARTASLGQQSGTFDIAEVKLEIGSVATPFSLAGGNIAGELAMAQRYYEKGSARLDTYATSGNNESINVFYKVTKRISVTPSVTNTSVVNFNVTPNVTGLDEGKFSIYHAATATGGANFADTWEANAEF